MNLLELIQNQTRVLKTSPLLQAKLERAIQADSVILIALCGETASGKTTLLETLKTQTPDLTVISADNYFCDIADKMRAAGSFAKLVESGYDTDGPDNFQMDVLVADLKALKAGRPIKMPRYEMLDGSSTAKAISCRPSKIVIVEGICTFYPPVRDLFDFKIYLSVERAIQWARYQKRAGGRGQNPATVRAQFEMVSLAAEKHILPNKPYADLIIETVERPLATQTKTKNSTLDKQRSI